MIEKPTQTEIDAVAHFIEAVRELQLSPFFIEEYRSLGISMREGDPKENIKGKFPDPDIFRGVLVPFRRLWNQNEPCHYVKVTNILKRHVADFRCFLDAVAFNEDRSNVRHFPWLKDIPLSVSDVIDLWLNTRYHHVGKSTRRGRFTREDFDRFNSAIGPVLFEFYFLSAVQEFGIYFFNISKCAESFLKCYAAQGITQSFASDAVEFESNVQRQTPGYTPEQNAPMQRAWRLRRRHHYDGLNYFFSLFECTDQRVAILVLECESFDRFADRLGALLTHTDDPSRTCLEDCTHFSGCIDNYVTAFRNRKCRRGSVAKRRDGTLIWSGDFVPILRDQYVEFRAAFLQEPFK